LDPLGGTNRLTLRLSLAITALVTSLLAVGLYALAEHHFRGMVEGRRRAAELQNRILEVTLRHQMLEKRPHSALIASILREVGSQPEVQNVMILDHDGIVRQSSRENLVGQRVSRDSATCLVCHLKAPAERTRWAVLDLPGGEVLRSVQPIENRPECYSCHAPEERLNGILILDVSLASLQAQLSRDRWWMVAATAALGCVLLLSVGVIVRRLILVRLAKLGGTARSIAAGDLTQRAAVSGDDTIAGLATDFNNMADAVLGLVSEVKERESQLANVMNSVDDGLVVIDRDFRIVAANHAFCRRFGTHPEALHGRRCQEALDGALHCEACGASCPSMRCLASGEVQRATFQLPPRNGEMGRVEEVHSSPVFDEDGTVCQVVEIWRDITERVREETRLAELERLESLGALAAGFSHEVSTPLATTLTCAEAILGRIEGREHSATPPATFEEIREIAETIRGQVLRCRTIT
jgi:PAS domain S-box-containing protein